MEPQRDDDENAGVVTIENCTRPVCSGSVFYKVRLTYSAKAHIMCMN